MENQNALDRPNEVLRCPQHPAGRLIAEPSGSDGVWRCPTCSAEYEIRGGIADFTGDSSLADPAYVAEMEQWDRQAPAYEDRRGRDAIYLAGVAAAVQSLAAKGGETILDAGCGTGMTVRAYVSSGATVTALDASIKSLRQLRTRLPPEAPVRLIRGNLAALPFADASFDAVLCANVLQQIQGDDVRRQCVKELGRVLRPGGRFVLTVHQYSLTHRWRGSQKEGGAGGHSGSVRYIYRYTSAELSCLLRSSIRLTRIYGAAFPLPYRLKLSPLSRQFEKFLRAIPAAKVFANMLVAEGRK